MKILITGREGQVAFELQRSLACLGDVIALDRKSDIRFDLSDADSMISACRSIKPDLIVNAAAYTAVDKAESDSDSAYQINAAAPGLLAQIAQDSGASLIHYSTDYVFSGQANTPYTETDETGPTGVYGLSKLKGEEAIIQSGAPHLIFRTAWVYGSRGQNFLLTMLRLMRERDHLRVVNDQFGAPTWSRLIAEATALAVARSIKNGKLDWQSGVYHLSSAGQCSWYDFAKAIREKALELGLLDESAATLEAIPGSDYPTPAKRPAYSVLCNDKLKAQFDIALPDWENALNLCFKEISR